MIKSNCYGNTIFLSGANLDSKYEHLLVELETSDTSTVALVLRFIFNSLHLLNLNTNCFGFLGLSMMETNMIDLWKSWI